jgi:hypothetical protein
MNTISLLQQADPGNGRHSEKENQETVTPYQHEINITDGSEFLDDAIRMKDQPLGETDENGMDDPLENVYE